MKNTCLYKGSVGVVGTGMVGSSFAFSLLQSNVASNLILIDSNFDRSYGEALDLNHGIPFVRPLKIKAGKIEDLCCCEIVVITAGLSQLPGESRLDLLQRNALIIKELVPKIIDVNPDGILLIASNPVDILTKIASEIPGVQKNKIFGTGTVLDTARFKYMLADYFNVDSRNLHAYIIGEHGDSEIPVWSLANISGVKLTKFAELINKPFDKKIMDNIFNKTRTAAHEIIKTKKATYYAIALAILAIVEAILKDQKAILTVSSPIDNYNGLTDVSISLPSIIGANGIEYTIDLPLSNDESLGFKKSAEILKQSKSKLNL